jgi:hypothetical protein
MTYLPTQGRSSRREVVRLVGEFLDEFGEVVAGELPLEAPPACS